jgi:hypothetical protein
MRINDLIISAILIVALAAGAASFAIPSLLDRAIVPQMPVQWPLHSFRRRN